MIRKLDDADFDAVGQFLDAGAHLVPYNREKTPPAWFKWGGESYDPADHMKIENVDEARAYNMDVPAHLCSDEERWFPDGFGIGIHVNTAECVVVDIDCLLPMDDAEYRKSKMSLTDYQNWKKSEWKSQPMDVIDEVLDGVSAMVMRECPSHAVMRSGSGKGLHFYYHCVDAGNYHRDHACIEIFAKKGRLAYATEWKLLDGFFQSAPVALGEITAYWEQKGDALYTINTMRETLVSRFNAPVVPKGQLNMESALQKSAYAQTGRNNRLYTALCIALRAGSESGWNDSISEARSSGLSDREINNVIGKARKTTGIFSV